MRDPEEKARFRGNDKAYGEGWDRIFGNKKDANENETTKTTDASDNSEGTKLRHNSEDASGLLPDDANERTELQREATGDS